MGVHKKCKEIIFRFFLSFIIIFSSLPIRGSFSSDKISTQSSQQEEQPRKGAQKEKQERNRQQKDEEKQLSSPQEQMQESENEVENEIQKSISDQESDGEASLNKLYADIIRKPLKQFGYDFFIKSSKAIAPVGDDYVLGPFDSLQVYIWGDPVDLQIIDRDLAITISADGNVYVPYLGMIQVSGLAVKDFKKLLEKKLSTKFRNLKLDVSVSKLRKFNIYLSGFVNSPGMKAVDSLDTLIDGLVVGGGVSKNGSLRNIEIKRRTNDGVTTIKVDLYDLFIKGLPCDIRLKDDDIIFVPPLGEIVGIAGEVKRPGIYELKGETKLYEVLEFAGGVNPSASNTFVRISSFSKDGLIIKEGFLNDETFLNTNLKNGDFIFIGTNPGVFENLVKVSGEVYYPGYYSVDDTPTLKDLLAKAKPLVNAKSIIITDAKKQQSFYIVEEVLQGTKNFEFKGSEEVLIVSKFINEPVYIVGEVEEPKTFFYHEDMTLLEVIKDIKYKNDVTNLKLIIRKVNEYKTVYLYDLLVKGVGNIKLSPGDIILVERKYENDKEPSVLVLGEVLKPGRYKIMPGKTKLYDSLKNAGGYTEHAYPEALVLIRESLGRLHRERLDVTIAVLEEEVIKSKSRYAFSDEAEARATMMAIQDMTRQLEIIKKKASLGFGRVALEIPSSLEDLKDSDQNILLEDEDTIVVPSFPNVVLVFGDVYNQIALPYKEDYRVKDYLKLVGGPTKSADIKDIYVIRANGRVISSQSYSGMQNYKPSQGDTIVVPTELKVPVMWRPLIRDVVQIIFQSLATVVLVKGLL
jgi:protein involved in polysaccharide export with SLBB domain